MTPHGEWRNESQKVCASHLGEDLDLRVGPLPAPGGISDRALRPTKHTQTMMCDKLHNVVIHWCVRMPLTAVTFPAAPGRDPGCVDTINKMNGCSSRLVASPRDPLLLSPGRGYQLQALF
ncbi:hypothetical protein NDU88_001102 [Pleurodeles waltl]|uniref:Uncharacterized protein n=1 Tax=Pleurodeles waltl TaxID=8319 RepID=A0AAV7RC02_PLEWA|nr:hypothetical protein NDU88_001102 [Pleurodeles waltl]